jgi:dihydroxyacid dehydratase/phosphogluconate dehydratase
MDSLLRHACAVPTSRAQSWTGRAVVSSETDTILSRIATSGIHRTRVSALRGAGPKASRIVTDAKTTRDFAHSHMQAAAEAKL